MCDFITPALMIATTVAAVASQAAQAASLASSARAQAQAEEAAAADAQARGAAEAGKIRTAASFAIGEAKTQVAASGIDAQSGSPLDAMESIRAGSELDVGMVKSNAARAAWGHTYQASQAEAAGKNAWVQGGLAMGASFLEGAAGLSSYYAKNPSLKPRGPAPIPPSTPRNPITRGF